MLWHFAYRLYFTTQNGGFANTISKQLNYFRIPLSSQKRITRTGYVGGSLGGTSTSPGTIGITEFFTIVNTISITVHFAQSHRPLLCKVQSQNWIELKVALFKWCRLKVSLKSFTWYGIWAKVSAIKHFFWGFPVLISLPGFFFALLWFSNVLHCFTDFCGFRE